MNNKTLLVIFVALLGVYFASKSFSGKKERSFKTELVKIDTTSITKIVLNTKADQHKEVALEKENGKWFATKDGLKVPAETNPVQGLLSQLVLIKTKRIAAKSPEKWVDYELTPEGANRVRVYNGNELLEDLMVGRFDFNQQARTATTFLRVKEDDAVYAVDGFLSMSFGQGFSAYRNKGLITISKSDITNINLKTINGNIQLQRNGVDWSHSNGTTIDSTAMDSYLNGLANLKGSAFVDNFNESSISSDSVEVITINGNNLLSPIVVTSFRRANAESPIVLKSASNANAYFGTTKAALYQKIFSIPEGK